MDNEYDGQELWDKVVESIGDWTVLKEDGDLIHAIMDVELDSGEQVKLYVRYDEIRGLDYIEEWNKDVMEDLIAMRVLTT